MSTDVKHKPCRRCVLEGPWRFDDDGNCIGKCDCIVAATAQAQAQALTAEAHKRAFEHAKQIITETAEQLPEFSGNTVREAMETAQIPSGVIGAAFSACARDSLIVASGRYVQSTESTTRHKIAVWESRIYRRASA